MKKIIVSLSIIAAAGAIVIGGTMAYFSSTAVSKDNTFAAGTLRLEAGEDGVVSWSNTPDGLLTLNNMAPGVASQDYIIRVRNAGTVPGKLKMESGFMTFASSDIPNAPTPDMSADQFARLVYVSTLKYDVIGDSQGYFDILPVVSVADANSDGKVSLYEISQMPAHTIDHILRHGDEIDLKMAFTLGDRFDECTDSHPWFWNETNPGRDDPHCVNDYDITKGEWNVPQGDGVKVTITGKLVQEEN